MDVLKQVLSCSVKMGWCLFVHQDSENHSMEGRMSSVTKNVLHVERVVNQVHINVLRHYITNDVISLYLLYITLN